MPRDSSAWSVPWQCQCSAIPEHDQCHRSAGSPPVAPMQRHSSAWSVPWQRQCSSIPVHDQRHGSADAAQSRCMISAITAPDQHQAALVVSIPFTPQGDTFLTMQCGNQYIDTHRDPWCTIVMHRSTHRWENPYQQNSLEAFALQIRCYYWMLRNYYYVRLGSY